MYKVNTIVRLDPKELVFVAGNRIVDEKHVAKLKADIQQKNLLHINPIKINTKGHIIDGQHRIRASLELGLKSVTCLVVAATIHDAQPLNQHSKNWTGMDFANYWAKQGNKEYQAYLDFVNVSGMHPSVGLEILGTTGGRDTNNFKKGTFKVRSIDYAYRFCDKLELFKPFLPGPFKSGGKNGGILFKPMALKSKYGKILP